ncbi:amidohydrolase family protein [Altererythrobacter sp. MF3-039]|uniref:amidohydrolase family protein n=1 Tax=Altererythrobacter sp. MF3-039 TaxID=3252901 RepID=UPI00390C5A26
MRRGNLARAMAAASGVLLALSACTSIPGDELQTASLVISDVTAIDAVNRARSDVDVVIMAEKIVAVGPDAGDGYRAEPGKRVNGSGKFLIPGLWDAHVHVTFDPDIDYRTFYPLSLAHGITALRDTGGHLDKLAPARAAAGQPDTPDLFVAGPLLDGELRVYDGSSAFFKDISIGVPSPEEGRAAVDRLAAEGVAFIKAYEMLAPDTFRAIVDQARMHGLPVSAHVPLSMTVAEAIDAGVDDLQHLRNLEFECAANSSALVAERQAMLEAGPAAADVPSAGALRGHIHGQQRQGALSSQDPQACETLIAVLADNGVFQTPTSHLNAGQVKQWYLTDEWRETFNMLPLELRARALQLTDREKQEPSPETLRYFEWNRATLARMEQAGVPLMAGTDAPILFMTPGISLHAELAQMVENGVSPIRALEAATVGPARFFGIENERGTIATGMKADLVLLAANPLDDIRNTQAIVAVVKDGALHDRSALDGMVKSVGNRP